MRIIGILMYCCSIFMQVAAAARSTTTPPTSALPSPSASAHKLYLHGTLHHSAYTSLIAAGAPTRPPTQTPTATPSLTITVNVTALIDNYQTHSVASSILAAATFAPPLSPQQAAANSTTSPRYIFVFGDSYSDTGFNLSSTKPSPLNPLGNPPYPGLTPQLGMQNWVDLLTVNAGIPVLTYDLAFGGASVDNSLTQGANANVPAFLNQTAEFESVLGVVPRPDFATWSETGEDSVVVIWFGRNDIFWCLLQGIEPAERHLDDVMDSFLLLCTRLVDTGVRRFVVLGVPPVEREPLWLKDGFRQFVSLLPGLVGYWNEHMRMRLERWREFYEDVQVHWVDVKSVFEAVLDEPAKYGAPDAVCTNAKKEGMSHGADCLWADSVHPGPVLNEKVAEAVGRELVRVRFFPDVSDTESLSASADAGTNAITGGG